MVLFYSFIVLISFVVMEGIAWLVHKYIMHGPLWRWHQSHHSPHTGFFEKNDLFNIFFSIPAIACFIIGQEIEAMHWLFWVGVGISLYGVVYFIFHDIIVHRRIKIRFTPVHPYIKNIIRAHKVHHRTMSREKGEAFGFLYSARNYNKAR